MVARNLNQMHLSQHLQQDAQNQTQCFRYPLTAKTMVEGLLAKSNLILSQHYRISLILRSYISNIVLVV